MDLKTGKVTAGTPLCTNAGPILAISGLTCASWKIAGAYDGKPDATFSFVDDDFLQIATGKLNPQMAFIR